MKELERYLVMVYSDIFQPDIMTETPETFPNPDIPTIMTDTITEPPKIDVEMTYLENKNIDEAIRQKSSKKDVYETNMHKIYNLIMSQTNEQLQEQVESDATFHDVKSGRYHIGYLMILKKLFLSNQSKQHPNLSLCLTNGKIYNTVQHAKKTRTITWSDF